MTLISRLSTIFAVTTAAVMIAISYLDPKIFDRFF